MYFFFRVQWPSSGSGRCGNKNDIRERKKKKNRVYRNHEKWIFCGIDFAVRSSIIIIMMGNGSLFFVWSKNILRNPFQRIFFSYSTELVFSQTFENFYIWIANLSSFLFFQRRIFGAILGWTTDGQLGSAPHFLQMQINTKM